MPLFLCLLPFLAILTCSSLEKGYIGTDKVPNTLFQKRSQTSWDNQKAILPISVRKKLEKAIQIGHWKVRSKSLLSEADTRASGMLRQVFFAYFRSVWPKNTQCALPHMRSAECTLCGVQNAPCAVCRVHSVHPAEFTVCSVHYGVCSAQNAVCAVCKACDLQSAHRALRRVSGVRCPVSGLCIVLSVQCAVRCAECAERRVCTAQCAKSAGCSLQCVRWCSVQR